MPLLAVGISLVSFATSGLTLYLTHFRRASISATVGPSFKIYYDTGKALSFYFPVTFFNRSHNIGAVSAVELILPIGEEEYRFPWRSFSRFDLPTNSWTFLDLVHATAVPGKSTAKHTIWFGWPFDAAVQPQIPPGVHRFRIRYQVLPGGEVHEIEERFVMSGEKAAELDGYRGKGISTTVDFFVGEKPVVHQRIGPDGSVTQYG